MQFYLIAILLLSGLSVYLLCEKYLVSCRLVQLQANLSMWDHGNASGEKLDGITRKPYQQELIERVRLDMRLSGFAASAPGFFYSYRHGMDGSNSMPFASAGITALFGLQPEDVESCIAPMTLRICRADLKLLIDEIARSAVDLTQLKIEFRIGHADKGMLWVESRAMPIAQADGSIVWHGFMHDITERKQLDDERKKSRDFLNNILNSVADPIFVKDSQHNWLFLNDAFCKFIGHPLESLLGKNDYDFFPAHQVKVFWDKDDAVLRSGLEDVNEEDFTDADGVVHSIITKKTRHMSADGQRYLVGVIRNETERKRLEKQLARREQEFRTLAENSPDVLVRYDCQCRFVYVNPLFEKLLGVRLEALQGKTPLQVPGLPDAEFFQQRVQEVIETGRADKFEYFHLLPEGEAAWRLVDIIPEYDLSGQFTHVLVSSRNISALKEVEQSLDESRARLRYLLARQGHRHEYERKQLSWSMHEDLLQTLASMHMHASMLSSESMDVCNELRISNLISDVKMSIDLVREMVVFLRPAVLNMGIHLALEWMVSEFNYQHPELIFNLEFDAETVQMDEKSSIVVFRIVQEVMVFTALYRKSAKACIALNRCDAGYRLILRDDSCEYDVEMSDSNCSGLYGLQELVMEMGGEMVIFSAPDHGLIIEANLPFQNT